MHGVYAHVFRASAPLRSGCAIEIKAVTAVLSQLVGVLSVWVCACVYSCEQVSFVTWCVCVCVYVCVQCASL